MDRPDLNSLDLDGLRQYAEAEAQRHGMATIIVVKLGEESVHEFVVTREARERYTRHGADEISAALVEGLRQQAEINAQVGLWQEGVNRRGKEGP
jgi:hypothetical protein